MDDADFIIDARWVIPVEPAQQVLEQHAVVVKSGDIVAIGPSTAIEARYPGVRHIALPEHVLIPGLVNLHTQAATSLMRGLVDERPPVESLAHPIRPLEMQTLSHAFVRDGTILAC